MTIFETNISKIESTVYIDEHTKRNKNTVSSHKYSSAEGKIYLYFNVFGISVCGVGIRMSARLKIAHVCVNWFAFERSAILIIIFVKPCLIELDQIGN